VPNHPDCPVNYAGFSEFVKEIEGKPRFFIIGKGKSGTTWMYYLFRNHPQVLLMAEERKLFERPNQNRAALLEPVLDSGFFLSRFKVSSIGMCFFRETNIRYELARLLSDYLLFREYGGSDRTRNKAYGFIGEKIALNSQDDAKRLMKYLREIYPEVKIIHIVRDPRDVAVSALFHRYRRYKQAGKWRIFTRHVEGLQQQGSGKSMIGALLTLASHLVEILRWKKVVETFERDGVSHYQKDYLRVRYEDLISDERNQVKALLDFIGLDSSGGVLAEIIQASSFEVLSSGRKAGQEDSRSFFRKGVSGDWRRYMGRFEAALARKLLGNMLEKHGYNWREV
jgi:hypothetical protein